MLTDGRTDGRTDGLTDGRKIGRLYRTLLEAGAIKRDEVLEETLGEWRVIGTSSSKQTDHSSCGVFALMVSGLAISMC